MNAQVFCIPLVMALCALGCSMPVLAEEARKVEEPKKASEPVKAGEAAKPATTAPAVHELQKTEPIAVIDGDLSKPQWQAAEKLRVDYSNGKLGALSDVPRMTARFLWDDHYLYIGYEFFTTDIQAASQGDKKQGPDGNQRTTSANWLKDRKIDIAEFFISFNDPNFFWEVHHNGLNQIHDIWVTVPDEKWPLNKQALVRYGIRFAADEYIEDEEEYRVAMAVKLLPKADGKPSTVNDSSDVDTGYSAEIRLPLWGIGASKARKTQIKVPAKSTTEHDTYLPGPWKMVGEEVQILAVYQAAALPDNDRYYHSGPTKPPGGWFHMLHPYWPRFKFVDRTVKPK